MKKFFSKSWRVGTALVWLIPLTFACKRFPEQQAESAKNYQVNIGYAGFETILRPLKETASPNISDPFSARSFGGGDEAPVTVLNWNFNSGKLISDYQLGPAVNFDHFPKAFPAAFVPSFENSFFGDKALQLKHMTFLSLEFPIGELKKLGTFSFDLGSDSLAGKTVEFQYRFADGINRINFPVRIDMENKKDDFAKTRIKFDLSSLPVEQENKMLVEIHFRRSQEDKELGRMQFGTYRLDNVRLTGYKKALDVRMKSKLRYYLFQKGTHALVDSGQVLLKDGNPQLNLELPLGEYILMSTYHYVNKDIISTGQISRLEDLHFQDDIGFEGRMFASCDTIEVSKSFAKEIALRRAYGQVRFEFTDSRDLKEVKRVLIKPQHLPVRWRPFSHVGQSKAAEEPSQSFEVEQDFNVHKEIVFNQFLGLHVQGKKLHYILEVWDDSKILRTIDVQGEANNNMQLVFRGQLLPRTTAVAGFEIKLVEAWDKEVLIEFN